MNATYTETNSPAGTKPRIDSLRVKWEYDNDADLSYLEQYDADSDDAEEAGYAVKDRERLEAYGDSWHMLGCTAEAEVSYSIGQGNRRIERFTSGGLWGIESDSERSFLEDTARNELSDLRDHLEQFGIDVSNFDELAADVELTA